jgi:glycosyltransferase involved in cell wall biosynthesis
MARDELRPRRSVGGPMAAPDLTENAALPFSVVIATFNDWRPLDECLRTLAEQSGAPEFEVVVVDDGSEHAAPEFVGAWGGHFRLRVERQTHEGISAARNHGARIARGSVLLFVDADCKLEKSCLAMLSAAIAQRPEDDYFQLQMSGDCSGLVGRAEALRLITLQKYMLQPDGHIRYLNTAGFAIRREKADISGGLFDPQALRAEDTLFLANLIEVGKLPWFASEATVQHAIPLSLGACLLKDVRSAYLEGRTYDVIASKGVRIRVTHRERMSMLRFMWKKSARPPIGRAAYFVLAARQTLRFVMLLITDYSGARFHSRMPAKSVEGQ